MMLWKQYSGDATGNYISFLRAYSGVDSDVKTSEHLSDAGWTCNTDYDDLWNCVFYDLLFMDREKDKTTKK